MQEETIAPSAGARSALLAAPMGLIAVCLLAPLALLFSYSIAPGGGTQADFSRGPTLANYADVLGDSFYLGVILKTIWTSILTTACSLLVGWPLAYFLWRAPQRFKPLLTVLVVAPLLISIPVRNYGWMVLLGDNGVVNLALLALGLVDRPLKLMFTEFAVLLGLTHVLMPFVVLSVLAALERMPPELEEAARTMGASRARTLCEVIIPLSMPGVVAGAILVFCVAMSSYVTPALMGPSGTRYAATLVYQQFASMFNWQRGAAIAVVLLILTALALASLLSANQWWHARRERSR